METIQLKETFPVTSDILYNAWLDSDIHAEFVGSSADINPIVGGKFNIWEGYITGTTIELVPGKKIVQKWRTTEFPDGSADSLLELTFTGKGASTVLTLVHSNIPDGQGESYKQGWIEYYFQPMLDYFSAEKD